MCLLMRRNPELKWLYSHADFVSANDEGDLATPGVDEAGPAAVDRDVFTISGTEPDRGVIEWLTCVLHNCWQWREEYV